MNLQLPDYIRRSIPRAQVMEAIRQLGFDPFDVREVHMFRDRLVVEVFIRNEQGDAVDSGEPGPLTTNVHVHIT